jgi:hypothetical protein
MSAHFPLPANENSWSTTDLSQLPRDLRRVLSVQFREFIHHIEDTQDDSELESNPRVISFLERCYKDAA